MTSKLNTVLFTTATIIALLCDTTHKMKKESHILGDDVVGETTTTRAMNLY